MAKAARKGEGMEKEVVVDGDENEKEVKEVVTVTDGEDEETGDDDDQAVPARPNEYVEFALLRRSFDR